MNNQLSKRLLQKMKKMGKTAEEVNQEMIAKENKRSNCKCPKGYHNIFENCRGY